MIIIVAPEFDLPTRYTSAWAKRAADLLKEADIPYTLLSGERATRKGFLDIVESHPGCSVFHFDHGTPNMLIGTSEVLINIDNVHKLAGCNVYSFSCQTAAHLGEAAIDAGVSTWLGYSVEVGFNTSIVDWMRRLALAPVVELLQGGTYQGALDATASLYQTFLSISGIASYSKMTQAWMLHNYQGLSLLGDATVRAATDLLKQASEVEDTWCTMAPSPAIPMGAEIDEEVSWIHGDSPKSPDRPSTPWVVNEKVSTNKGQPYDRLHWNMPTEIYEAQGPTGQDSQESVSPGLSLFHADRPSLLKPALHPSSFTEHPDGVLPLDPLS